MNNTNAVLALLGTVFGGGSIFLGIFGRKKTQAEAETEAIKGSSLVVEMYEKLAGRYEFRIGQLEKSLDTSRDAFAAEHRRCDDLEMQVRQMRHDISRLQGEL